MGKLSWAASVRLVHKRANYCCEYCQTCQDIIGQAMHVDHIQPGGGDHPDNLCLSCSACNQSKSRTTNAVDPDSGSTELLFNPRTQKWTDHFRWIDGGLRVLGLTPTGRATVSRLKMNQERIVIARSLWINAGLHPRS